MLPCVIAADARQVMENKDSVRALNVIHESCLAIPNRPRGHQASPGLVPSPLV